MRIGAVEQDGQVACNLVVQALQVRLVGLDTAAQGGAGDALEDLKPLRAKPSADGLYDRARRHGEGAGGGQEPVGADA